MTFIKLSRVMKDCIGVGVGLEIALSFIICFSNCAIGGLSHCRRLSL